MLTESRSTKTAADPHATDAWYSDGLRFTCTRCGDCCTGTPGYVYVTKNEIETIAAHIGRQGKGLPRKHVRRIGRRTLLTEDAATGDCCFLRRNGGKLICGIYPVRPLQCQTWPFWDGNLKSPSAWASVSLGCPGINNGTFHDFVQIEIRRKAKRWEGLPE